MSKFDVSDYTITGNAVWYEPAQERVTELPDNWTVLDVLTAVEQHARLLWEGTLPEGVETSRVLDLNDIYDQVSCGAGAAGSPVGPLGVLVLELASSARPSEPPRTVNIVQPAGALRDLRRVFVRAFGEAIRQADQAARRPS